MSKNFKSARKLAMILAIGSMSLSAMAGSNPGGEDTELLFTPTGTTSTVVVKALNLTAEGSATIKILNRFGRIVYTDAIESSEDDQKQYNFSKMKPGRYTLVLESQTKNLDRAFVVGMNGVVREDHTEALKSFSPYIIEDREQLSVKVMFENPVSDILTVEMLDEDGQCILRDKVAGKQRYGKLINMKKLPRGQYRIKVYNYDYSHIVDVRR